MSTVRRAAAIVLTVLLAIPVVAAERSDVPLTPVEEQALKPKDSFKEGPQCPEMVVVPAGSFMMGSPSNEAGRSDNEGPQRQVTIARPFAVGKFEVTPIGTGLTISAPQQVRQLTRVTTDRVLNALDLAGLTRSSPRCGARKMRVRICRRDGVWRSSYRGAGQARREREMVVSTRDFSTDGFLVVRNAVAPDIVQACVEVIEEQLRTRGVDPRDPATWTAPVVRFPCPEGPAFAAAGTSPALQEAYDALLGSDRWIRRKGVGGSIPVRFPSMHDPGDAGWHIDGSYDVGGQWWVNVHSRHRGLLVLFLFTDVGPEDAPTEILVGSHLDIARQSG